MNARRPSESGSTMVEFALTITLFLVMLFGIVDFGRAMYTYHFLSNAARDATRWAAVNGATCNNDGSCNGTGGMNSGPATQADVLNYVKGITPPGIDSTKIIVPAGGACGLAGGSKCAGSPTNCTLNQPGCLVQIKLSYPFGFLVPLVHKSAITLSSTSEMVISH
jgi:TadE-like protein